MSAPELLSEQARLSPARAVDEMARLYYLSRAIHVATELGIADELGETPVALEAVAIKTKTDAAALKRLVGFLAGYGIFAEHSQGVVNTPLSAVLRSDHPNSVAANVRRIGNFWWTAVGQMEHSIRTGEAAFDHVHEMSFFQYIRAHPDIQQRFDLAMARISDADDAAVAAAYDFSRFRRIMDIGGGRGGLLVQILKRAPAATGILYEQPQVIANASRLKDAGLEARSELVSGDFFKSVPGGCDCYVIKGVLHDFDDDGCVRILSNCRKSMAAGSRIVIANLDLPARIDGPHPNRTMDIQMMTLLGGRERSPAEWSDLFQRAGLTATGTFQTSVGFVLVEGQSN
jgi:C-methyltransferase